MTTIYKCDTCGQEFNNSRACRLHEGNHFYGVDKLKYELIYTHEEHICDYCDCSYYVYGVERACEHKDCHHANNYKDFVPTEPLHDKSRYGV